MAKPEISAVERNEDESPHHYPSRLPFVSPLYALSSFSQHIEMGYAMDPMLREFVPCRHMKMEDDVHVAVGQLF